VVPRVARELAELFIEPRRPLVQLQRAEGETWRGSGRGLSSADAATSTGRTRPDAAAATFEPCGLLDHVCFGGASACCFGLPREPGRWLYDGGSACPATGGTASSASASASSRATVPSSRQRHGALRRPAISRDEAQGSGPGQVARGPRKLARTTLLRPEQSGHWQRARRDSLCGGQPPSDQGAGSDKMQRQRRSNSLLCSPPRRVPL
jgi:hypothetical protein